VLDRVSQYCISNVINLSPPQPKEWFFRVLLFKFYNRIATWELLETALGIPTWKNFKFKDYASTLDAAYNRGECLFGGAYRANQKYRFDLMGTHLRYLALL
jgi:alpha-glutamyl/putrescinyl thymine pyrophosphorylase clade 1